MVDSRNIGAALEQMELLHVYSFAIAPFSIGMELNAAENVVWERANLITQISRAQYVLTVRDKKNGGGDSFTKYFVDFLDRKREVLNCRRNKPSVLSSSTQP